jgi:very-short-patch-repair endonuclease
MPNQSAKVRVAAVAGRQWGRITWRQLRALVSSATIADWLDQGYLHRLLPSVYAVGHAGRSTEGDLAAALLYAGPEAALSHATAAWWLGLADHRPATIDVSTPRRCRSRPGIRVHQRRRVERTWHNRLPVTPVPQTLRDYAADASWPKLRRALANADYHRILDVQALDAELRRGRNGAARLRKALKRHRPELAHVRSDLEVTFFELCERARLPLPRVNARVHGWTVDFFWSDRKLVVEVDGGGNHRTPAQMRRDRRMDATLRGKGLTVLRYSDEQVNHDRQAVITELRCVNPPGPSA